MVRSAWNTLSCGATLYTAACGLDLRISATVVMGTSSCVMGQAPISAQAERDCKPWQPGGPVRMANRQRPYDKGTDFPCTPLGDRMIILKTGIVN